jgi:hypothetical protein
MGVRGQYQSGPSSPLASAINQVAHGWHCVCIYCLQGHRG